jgi:protein-disulfide isomerase
VNTLLAINLTVSAAVFIAVWRNHQKLVDHLDWRFHRQNRNLKGVIAVSAQDTVNAVVAQLRKVSVEVTSARDALTAKVDALQAQIDAGVPVEELDLTALKNVAQSLDDLNPDADDVDVDVDVPVDEPTEVPDEVPAEVVGDDIEDDDEPVDADAPADEQ